MTAWDLPSSLSIGGEDFSIRTDFRAILDILAAYSDPELEDDEKMLVCLSILYVDFEKIPQEHYEEAMKKAIEFIDMGQTPDDKPSPRLMDWEYDAAVIIPEVNKNLGYEVRTSKETHWWTFLGAYMGIGDGLYSNIINIRQKRSKGKKLEKYEQEYYRENKKLIDLPAHLTEEQQKAADDEKERLEKLLRGEI